MTALATAQGKEFTPSLLEAPEDSDPGGPRAKKEKERAPKPNYTIDTIKRLKRSFKKADRLFLLIGIDAFADIAKWHECEALFRECEFVVPSRPGYSLADVANAPPARLGQRAGVLFGGSPQPPARQRAAAGGSHSAISKASRQRGSDAEWR